MANKQDITNSYLSVGSVKPVGLSLQVSPITSLSTKETKQTTTDVGLADYNDPKQINSLADIIMNAQIKKQKYGGPDNIYLNNLLNTIPATVDYLKDYIVKPIVSGRIDYLGLNLLTNLQETADIVANPTKGFIMGLPEGKAIENVLSANGFSEEGRKNFDWDSGSIVGDIILETLSDPLNYISFGAKAAASTAVKGAAKNIAKEVGNETAETVIKKAAQGFVRGKYDTLTEGIEQVNKKLGHNVLSRWYGKNIRALDVIELDQVAKRASKEINHTVLNTIGQTYKALNLVDDVIAKASLSFLPGLVLGKAVSGGVKAYKQSRYAKVIRLFNATGRSYSSKDITLRDIETVLRAAEKEDLLEEAQQLSIVGLYNDLKTVKGIIYDSADAAQIIKKLDDYTQMKHKLSFENYRLKVIELAKTTGWDSAANGLQATFDNLSKRLELEQQQRDILVQYQDKYIREFLNHQEQLARTSEEAAQVYQTVLTKYNLIKASDADQSIQFDELINTLKQYTSDTPFDKTMKNVGDTTYQKMLADLQSAHTLRVSEISKRQQDIEQELLELKRLIKRKEYRQTQLRKKGQDTTEIHEELVQLRAERTALMNTIDMYTELNNQELNAVIQEYYAAVKELQKALTQKSRAVYTSLKAEIPTTQEIIDTLRLLEKEGLITHVPAGIVDYTQRLRFLKVSEIAQNLPLLEAISPVLQLYRTIMDNPEQRKYLNEVFKTLSEEGKENAIKTFKGLAQLESVKEIYYTLLSEDPDYMLRDVSEKLRADLLDILSHPEYTSRTISELQDDPNFIPSVIEKLDTTQITRAEEDLISVQATNKLEHLMKTTGLYKEGADYTDIKTRVEALEELYNLQTERHKLPIFLDVETDPAGNLIKFAYKLPNQPAIVVQKNTSGETALELMRVTEYTAFKEGVKKQDSKFVTFGIYQKRMQDLKRQAYMHIDMLISQAQEKYLTVDKFVVDNNPPHDIQLFNRAVAPLKRLRAHAKYGFGKYQQPFELNKVFNPNTVDTNIKAQIAEWLRKQLYNGPYNKDINYKWLELPDYETLTKSSVMFQNTNYSDVVNKAFEDYGKVMESNRALYNLVTDYQLSTDRHAYAKLLQLQQQKRFPILSTQSPTSSGAAQRFIKITKALKPDVIARSTAAAASAYELSKDWIIGGYELLTDFVQDAEEKCGADYFYHLLEANKQALGLDALHAENTVDAYILLRYINAAYENHIYDEVVEDVTKQLEAQTVLLESKNLISYPKINYVPVELSSKDMSLMRVENELINTAIMSEDLTTALKDVGYVLEKQAMSNKKAFELHAMLRPLLPAINKYNEIYAVEDSMLQPLLASRRRFNDDLQMQMFEKVAEYSPKEFLSFLVHKAMGRITFSLDDMSTDRMLQAWQKILSNASELKKLGITIDYDGPRVFISLSDKWTVDALKNVPDIDISELNFGTVRQFYNPPDAETILNVIRTMEAFTKEADSLSIKNALGDLGDIDYYKKLDAKIPEDIYKKTLSSRQVMQAFPDKKFSFGYSNLGLTASVRDFDSFYSSDIIKRYAKTAQVMARAAETKIQLREVFFDESFSLKDSILFDEFSDAEILEALRRSPQYTLCALVTDANGVEKVIKFDPKYLTDLKAARNLNPVLLPTTFYNQFQNVINKFELPEGPLTLWNKILYLYKVGYLFSAGAMFRNLAEGIYKNMMETGEVGDMARAYYKANELFNLYEKTYRDIIMVDEAPVARMKDLPDTARMTDDKVTKYFKSDKAVLTKEEFFKLHEVIGNLGIGMSKELQNYFFRNSAKEKGLWSTILGWTGNMLSPHNKIEQLNRLALYLVKKDQGFADIEIFDRIGRAHIDMESKTKVDHIMSLIFPFYTFATKNMAYYMELLDKNHFLYRLLTDIMTPILDLDDRNFEELAYNRSLSYQILAGNVIFENDVVFKINPSFMDVFNNLATPIKAVEDKLAAPIKLPFELAAEDADVTKLLVENIPMLGTWLQRVNSAKGYMERTNNNPLNAIPTLFGAVKRYTPNTTQRQYPTGFGQQSKYKLRVAGVQKVKPVTAKFNGTTYTRRNYTPSTYRYRRYNNYRRYTPNLYKQFYTNSGRSRAELLYRNSDQRLAQRFRIRYRIQYIRNLMKYN